jgi:hypothetical protein
MRETLSQKVRCKLPELSLLVRTVAGLETASALIRLLSLARGDVRASGDVLAMVFGTPGLLKLDAVSRLISSVLELCFDEWTSEQSLEPEQAVVEQFFALTLMLCSQGMHTE